MKVNGFIFFLLSISQVVVGQSYSFDSFISRLARQYQVDVAIAPELIPVLDSIKNEGHSMTSLEDFLQQILRDREVTYKIIDGNKVLLRRESDPNINGEMFLIRGTVLDNRDQAPLAYSAVSILNSTRGTYTDENGNFMLYVDKTDTDIQFSYLGYKPITIPVTEFANSPGVVEMETDNISLDQVVIIVPFQQMSNGDNQAVDLKGYQFFSSEELLNWNAERLITRLTGYTHFSSEKGIRIRSSEEENSLIMMDGIPVYDPYHFYNIFSPFNGHYFSEVHLYKNNMPVQYGGRIDGLIELTSGSKEKGSSLILDTDLLLSSISADIEIADDIRLIAGGRFSHTGLIKEDLSDSTTMNFMNGDFREENEFTTSQEPVFNFYDLNLGLNIDIGVRSDINFSYFKSNDYLDNVIESELSIPILNKEIILIEQTIKSSDDWKNEGLAGSFQTELSDKIQFSVKGFLSSFEKTSAYKALLKENFPNMPRMTVRTGFLNSVLQSGGIKAYVESTPGKNNYIIGIDLQRHEVDLLAKENTTPYLLEVQREHEATLFGEYKTLFPGNVELAAGGRLTYLQSTSRIYLQPNIRLNYLMNDEWTIKSAFSKNIQSLRELTVENRFGREIEFLALSQPDANYPILRSDKYMIGATYEGKSIILNGEVYYKKTNGLVTVRALRPDPSIGDQTSPGDFYRLFVGDGWTAGFDLLATYKTRKSETSISYTLSKITQQFDQLFNGESYSPTEDRRHQLKLSSQYRMGSFIASGLINFKTKAPYTSFRRVSDHDQQGIGMVDHELVTDYLPEYFSLDLALDYSFKIAKEQALVGVSVINATNHININDKQQIGRLPRGQGMGDLFLTNETELLGRTVNIHFRVLIE